MTRYNLRLYEEDGHNTEKKKTIDCFNHRVVALVAIMSGL